MGWAKSKIYYSRLVLKDELTAIQEAFLVYVEFRKEQLKLMELQIIASTGITIATAPETTCSKKSTETISLAFFISACG